MTPSKHALGDTGKEKFPFDIRKLPAEPGSGKGSDLWPVGNEGRKLGQVSTVASQREVPGFESSSHFLPHIYLGSLCLLSIVQRHALSGVRLVILNSKLAIGVSVNANGCLSLWVSSVTCPGCTLFFAWDSFQPPNDPELDKPQNRWMGMWWLLLFCRCLYRQRVSIQYHIKARGLIQRWSFHIVSIWCDCYIGRLGCDLSNLFYYTYTQKPTGTNV